MASRLLGRRRYLYVPQRIRLNLAAEHHSSISRLLGGNLGRGLHWVNLSRIKTSTAELLA
jgi:hypothetical protein